MAENWSYARHINGRDKEETSASRDREVDNFCWDKI